MKAVLLPYYQGYFTTNIALEITVTVVPTFTGEPTTGHRRQLAIYLMLIAF